MRHFIEILLGLSSRSKTFTFAVQPRAENSDIQGLNSVYFAILAAITNKIWKKGFKLSLNLTKEKGLT